MKSLGDLKIPFVGASAAIYLLTFMWVVDNYNSNKTVIYTAVVGTLLVVVLYAIMRTIGIRHAIKDKGNER